MTYSFRPVLNLLTTANISDRSVNICYENLRSVGNVFRAFALLFPHIRGINVAHLLQQLKKDSDK